MCLIQGELVRKPLRSHTATGSSKDSPSLFIKILCNYIVGILFVYLWLRWIFVAASEVSLAVNERGLLSGCGALASNAVAFLVAEPWTLGT